MNLFDHNSPMAQALAEGTPVTVVKHPAGGYIARVGNGAAAGYYLLPDASFEARVQFNSNQCRHLFK